MKAAIAAAETPAPATRRTRDPVVRVVAAVALLGLAFAAPPVWRAAFAEHTSRNKDYSLWYAIGLAVRAGEPMYRPAPDSLEIRYTYPPTLAVLVLAPLSYLGYAGFVGVYALGNALAWAICVGWTPRLVAGPGERLTWASVLLPVAATGAYVWDMFHLGQVNLILLVLMLAAWAALRNGRPGLAGMAVGAAVAVKVFPLPVLVYFAARRQWTAVAAGVATCAVMVAVLPAPVRGFERNCRELGEWGWMMVADQSGNTMAARTGIGFTWRNSSLVSVAHRLLRPVEAGDRDDVFFRVNVADLTPPQAQAVGYGGCLLLGAVLLWATRLRFAPTPAAEGLEWGMVLTLVVLCSPISWTYFFCWLLPAWAAAVRFCTRTRSRWAVIGCAIAGVFLAAAGTQLVDPILSAYGTSTWGAVVLFLVLAGMRRVEVIPPGGVLVSGATVLGRRVKLLRIPVGTRAAVT
jgi:hypothetical protein